MNYIEEDLTNKLHQKYGQDIYISGEQLSLLNDLKININEFKNTNELLLFLNQYLTSNQETENEQIEMLIEDLQNNMYYNYYHK